MMTIEKSRSKTDPNSPPLHVHVDQQTPVHVHVKKSGVLKKSSTAKAVEERLRKTKLAASSSSRNFGAGNLRPTASAKGPWVPAPAKATRSKKFGWQSSTHSLSIEPPDNVHSTMRMEDLDRDDDSYDDDRFQKYEKKIDSLMTQVGSLKSQRDLERTKRFAEKTKDDLNLSRKVIENQEEEINEFREELEMTDRENRQLRRSVERLKEETDYTSTAERAMDHREHDQLLKKMVEAEIDAGAAAQQVTTLRDVCQRLKEEKRVSSHDAKVLTKQRDLLLQKLEDFENTNATLRQMLREQHRAEATKGHTEEQRDVLLKKLTESDASNQKLRVAVMEKNHELDSLKSILDAEREQGRSMAELQSSIESTRAHLQNQLRKREGDCNRMAVQIRKLENQIEQEHIEVDHLQELLQSAKEKALADKDALKKATRAQKERATRSEDAVEKLNSQLLEVETEFAETRLTMDQLKSKHDKLGREKGQIEGDNSALSRRIEELESKFRENELNNRIALDEVSAKLQSKTGDASSAKLENDKLKSTLATVQDKLTFAESEIDQLKSSLHEYENLVSDYKSKMNRSRREALDVSMRLEQEEQEKSRIQQDSNAALQGVHSELADCKDVLQDTQKKLNSTQERLIYTEEKLQETSHVKCELNTSLQELDGTKAKLRTTEDKLHDLSHVQEDLEMKIKELDKTQQKLQETEQKLHDTTNVHGELQKQVKDLEATCTKLNNIEHKLEDTTHVHDELEQCKRELQQTTCRLIEAESIGVQFDHVREKLEIRLKELEPLPGMLHNTEQQLLDAKEKLSAQERRTMEQGGIIAELTKKVEHQSDQMEGFREKWHAAQDEARSLRAQLESMQRRLKEYEDENRELHAGVAKREEIVHQNQLRLEEKTRENSSLTHQLEQAIADTRRLEEEAREKAIQRERNSQARILDLESQLSRCKTEVLQVKRHKEDTERKFNSQLYDLKDRLEQSHSTNRSMQNYVQFLKNSYSNVFGDASFGGSPYKSRHSPLH